MDRAQQASSSPLSLSLSLSLSLAVDLVVRNLRPCGLFSIVRLFSGGRQPRGEGEKRNRHVGTRVAPRSRDDLSYRAENHSHRHYHECRRTRDAYTLSFSLALLHERVHISCIRELKNASISYHSSALWLSLLSNWRLCVAMRH